ncbi:MAG: MBL fold metallo-hydrolase [Lachnospiraceae bacterium]|nr:MBL fold metallo-hydrolase [Lachnospiraceae bacterium]
MDNYKTFKKTFKKYFILLMSLVLFLHGSLYPKLYFPEKRTDAATLKRAVFAYLDVAQGNAELIKIGKRSILIDTGRLSEYDELMKQLKKLKVKRISTLVVSHPHADHMESASLVIQKYKVKKIIMPKIKSDTKCYVRMKRAIRKYKVKKVIPKTGNRLKLAEGCYAKILSVDASSSDKNEASIVMRVTYGKRSFLYMGDATARVEHNIMASGMTYASDIYLISHHGSDAANGIMFVKNALLSAYGVAVISVGKNNSYGHPTKFVLRRVKKYSQYLFRTDKNGAIIFYTNGNNLKYRCIKVKHSSKNNYSYSSYSSSSSSKNKSKATSSSKNTSSKSKKTKSKKYVYITETGSKYHHKGCRYLSDSCIKIRLKKAKRLGYTPCSRCC